MWLFAQTILAACAPSPSGVQADAAVNLDCHGRVATHGSSVISQSQLAEFVTESGTAARLPADTAGLTLLSAGRVTNGLKGVWIGLSSYDINREYVEFLFSPSAEPVCSAEWVPNELRATTDGLKVYKDASGPSDRYAVAFRLDDELALELTVGWAPHHSPSSETQALAVVKRRIELARNRAYGVQ